MRLNFKKVSAIAASALMVGMTMGVAAAANYPNPFVVSGAANVAIVYGTGAGVSSLDVVQAGNIESNLQSYMASTSGSSTGSISGEAAALFGGSTKLFVNSTLNSVRTSLTKADLPNLLADQTFSGNVDATVTETIQIGNFPTIAYKAQPTSSDDPQFGLTESTSVATNPTFNLTATFNKAVNFTHADSEGQTIHLFGMDFTVSSSTDASNLVLLKSAQKVDLTRDVSSASASSPNAVTTVTIGGQTYTIELISGSDTASTVKVTDSTGASSTQTISEASSKKVQGLTVAVTSSTQAGNVVSASIVAGSDKLTLQQGSAVMQGDSNTIIDGTMVNMGYTNGVGDITRLTIQFAAPNSDHDAINSGQSYVDPVFGTVKLDFAGLNIPENSTARESVSVVNSGDDMMQVGFTEFRGNAVTMTFAKKALSMNLLNNVLNAAANMRNGQMVADSDGHNITVRERGLVRAGGYVVVGNQDKGYLLKLSSTQNGTTGTSSDRATFVDVATGNTLQDVVWTSDGVGTLTAPDGNTYTVNMIGDANNGSSDRAVRLRYPDGSRTASTTSVLYPTIQTQKGAKLMFYQPQLINLTNWDDGDQDQTGTTFQNLTSLKIPNGNGYGTVTIGVNTTGLLSGGWNISSTDTSTICNLNTVSSDNSASCAVKVGKFMYNFTNVPGVGNVTKVFLQTPGSANIPTPAIVLMEEKDYNNEYNGFVTTLTNDSTYMNVNAITDTWTNGSSAWSSSVHSNNKLTKRADYFGTVTTTDTSDSHHTIGMLSYPDEQLYAQLYMGATSSAVIPGTVGVAGTTQLGDVLVKDSEVSSVSAKNLIVVGGSCINSVAANLLGAPACSADFTTKTGIGSGQFLIQSFASSYSTGKIALLVAGYEAADTVNAATYLRTQVIDTTVGKKYQGTSATTATLVTTSA